MLALDALHATVLYGRYDQSVGFNQFFGENCLLVPAYRQAHKQNRSSEFAVYLDRLLKDAGEGNGARQLYKSTAADLDQGMFLLKGYCSVLRALSGSDKASIATLLDEAVSYFDSALGLPPKGMTSSVEARSLWENRFDRQLGRKLPPSIAYWMARDLYCRIGDEESESKPDGAATTPVLLADDLVYPPTGHVVNLTVELWRNGDGTFYPDPFALGLTTLERSASSAHEDRPTQNWSAPPSPVGFYESLQRAWGLLGLGAGWRGRWKLTGRGGRPCALASISGRSAEAAVCCALWAAKDAAESPEGESHDWLDAPAAITATVDAVAPDGGTTMAPQKLAELPLGTVAVQTIPLKLQAIVQERQERVDAPLDLILVGDGQKEGIATDAAKPIGQREGIDVIEAKTLGEACERLTEANRIQRNYHQMVVSDWVERWTNVDENGEVIGRTQ